MLMDPATLRDGFKPTGPALCARRAGHRQRATAFPGGPPAGATGATAGRTAPLQAFEQAAEPGRRRRHRHAVRLPLGAAAEPLRPARRAGLGQQRRPRLERARQPRRQQRPDQHPRPRDVHAALRSRRGAAPLGRGSLPRQGTGTGAAAAGDRAEARRAGDRPGRNPPKCCCRRSRKANRALPAGEAAHPQGPARRAAAARPGHPRARQRTEVHQHRRAAADLRRRRAAGRLLAPPSAGGDRDAAARQGCAAAGRRAGRPHDPPAARPARARRAARHGRGVLAVVAAPSRARGARRRPAVAPVARRGQRRDRGPHQPWRRLADHAAAGNRRLDGARAPLPRRCRQGAEAPAGPRGPGGRRGEDPRSRPATPCWASRTSRRPRRAARASTSRRAAARSRA